MTVLNVFYTMTGWTRVEVPEDLDTDDDEAVERAADQAVRRQKFEDLSGEFYIDTVEIEDDPA